MIWRSLAARLLLVLAVVTTLLVITAAAAPTNQLSFSAILGPIAVVAGSAVGSFVLAVFLDDVAGILVAVKTKTFDAHKLKSFLSSQFGTREALALAGIVATAVTTAAGAYLLKGGLTVDALQAIADAAFAAATAGAAAMLFSVVADLFGKVSQLVGSSIPPPAPAKP